MMHTSNMFAPPVIQTPFSGVYTNTQTSTTPSPVTYVHSPLYYTTSPTILPHTPHTSSQQLYIPPPAGFSYPNHIPPYSHHSHVPPVTPPPYRSEFSNYNPIPKLEFPKFDALTQKVG